MSSLYRATGEVEREWTNGLRRFSYNSVMNRVLLLAPLLFAAGCSFESSDEVVVYSALDREFSEPILERFTRESGVTTLPKYDLESAKTVGLTMAIIAEANRPRCDVFWNNEILNTLRLKDKGLLD